MSEPRERMVRLLAVVDRDWKKFRRNPVVIAMSVLMPIIYLVILGNSFQGKLIGLPLAVVDQDSGPYARSLLDNLRAIQAGPRTIRLWHLADEQRAVTGVREGRYLAALVIPTDFSRRVVGRARPELGLFLDNTDGIASQGLRGAVSGAVAALGNDYVAIRESPQQTHLRNIPLYRQIDYVQSLVPGVVIMAIFLGAMTTGVFNLVMDRFLGVEEAYLLTPLTKADIVGGLILSGLSITTLVALLVLALGMAITGMPPPARGEQYLLILFVIVLTTLSLLSLMFTLLVRAGHPRIVGVLSGFLNVILFFPSGAIYPVASLPGWLQWAARFNPESHAVAALKAVLFKGVTLQAVQGDIAFLALFAAMTMLLAILLLKRRL
jgi:ABC-2 type transport system permease protein